MTNVELVEGELRALTKAVGLWNDLNIILTQRGLNVVDGAVTHIESEADGYMGWIGIGEHGEPCFTPASTHPGAIS